MSSTIFRLALLAGAAATTLVAFTGPATSASERSLAPAAKIVFHSRLSRNNGIYVVNANGTGRLRLTGTRIVFVSERIAKGQRRLFSVRPVGGAATQVTRGSYDMSPDWHRG